MQKLLIRLGACEEAREWVGARTLEQAWAECVRPDWMLWLHARSKSADSHAYAALAKKWAGAAADARGAAEASVAAEEAGAAARAAEAAAEAAVEEAAWAAAWAARAAEAAVEKETHLDLIAIARAALKGDSDE